MLIYNVTVKVESAIAANWLQWMQQEHIPEVMQTACFTEYKIARLLEVDDTEGPTYAIQYSAPDYLAYATYIDRHSSGLRKKVTDKWGNRLIAFRTLMEIVS
jgi:hypothetical protein